MYNVYGKKRPTCFFVIFYEPQILIKFGRSFSE